MERSEGNEVLNGLHALLGHEGGLLEGLAAVEHAVAARADLVQGRDRAVLLVGQRVQNGRDGLGVVGHVAGELDHLVALGNGLLEVGALDADALDKALRLDRLILHVDQLELQGRRTGVDDQNLHGNLPPFVFVIHAWHVIIGLSLE